MNLSVGIVGQSSPSLDFNFEVEIPSPRKIRIITQRNKYGRIVRSIPPEMCFKSTPKSLCGLLQSCGVLNGLNKLFFDKIRLDTGEKENMYSEFLEVSKLTGVPVRKVIDVFWHLSRGEAVGNNELVRLVGVSRNALNQVKKALSVYLSPTRKDTSLKVDIAERIGELYTDNYSVEEQLLATLTESDLYKRSVDLLLRYKGNRPVPKRNYDQFTATVETTARRAMLLDFLGEVRGKRVLFLGDDDFASLATANLRSAQDIVVLDIDERILDNIERISEELSLGIRMTKHDLRIPIPSELRGKFDTVFTDPPYTPEGIRLFVSRAIEALDKKNQTARICVCFGNSDRAKERFLPVQETLTDSGLMIRWTFDRFNRYNGAESIGSSSSLYVAEITPRTKPIIRGNYGKPIYTID